jgi:hypothetical protein
MRILWAGGKKKNHDYDPNRLIGKCKWIYSLGGFAGTTYPQEGQTKLVNGTALLPENWFKVFPHFAHDVNNIALVVYKHTGRNRVLK